MLFLDAGASLVVTLSLSRSVTQSVWSRFVYLGADAIVGDFGASCKVALLILVCLRNFASIDLPSLVWPTGVKFS